MAMASECKCGCCGPADQDLDGRSREELEQARQDAERRLAELDRRLREAVGGGGS